MVAVRQAAMSLFSTVGTDKGVRVAEEVAPGPRVSAAD